MFGIISLPNSRDDAPAFFSRISIKNFFLKIYNVIDTQSDRGDVGFSRYPVNRPILSIIPYPNLVLLVFNFVKQIVASARFSIWYLMNGL